MSSTAFSQENSSTVQTRRTPTRNDDTGNNSQPSANRRSLSSKFRSLFQKNSSPDRTTNNDRLPSPPPARQTSPSPETIRASTEAPHLQAPLISWPFGKKKKTTTTTTDNKKKAKNIRKMKKKSQPPPPQIEISAPVYVDDYQTSIRGQNFVPRTPELAHGGTGRTQSSTSYETETKGFRDYVVIDHPKGSQQVVVTNDDVITPPPYTSDRSHSPSFNYQRASYTNVEYPYPYQYDTSPSTRPISDIEVLPAPQLQRKVNDPYALTTTQILAEQTPILPQTSVYPATTNSNQWKGTSYSSLNHNDIHLTASPSIDIDAPKLHTPFVPLSSKPSKRESTRTDSQSRFDQTYYSSSNITNPIQTNRPYPGTYNSLPDTEIVYNGNLTQLTPTQSYTGTYPGISAIIEHHLGLRPTYDNGYPSKTTINPQRTNRYEASTTTFDDYDQQQKSQWSSNSMNNLSPYIQHTDGYIRPLTPPKYSIQPDVSVVHINPNDFKSPSRTTYSDSSEIPLTYRSSTTIFTKDKNNKLDSGEIRTWSNRGNDDLNANKQSSTSIFIEPPRNDYQTVPTNIKTEYPYNPRILEQKINDYGQQNEEKYEVKYEYERPYHQQYLYDTKYYSTNQYPNNDENSNVTRPLIISERERLYDQSVHSYIDTGHTQEPLNTRIRDENSDVALRHYTLNRTDSYNGLGLVISADVETRLNHRIRDVEPSSPSSQVGLRKNDRIVTVNGVNVENVEFADVLILIQQGLNNNNLQFSVINEAVLI